MQYGYFDDEAREYVITRPDTPRSWSNYLGTTEYGAIITNNAGGYSFYKSAAQGRFTRIRFNSIPIDQPGRYLYLRDQETGDFWSGSWQPVGKPLNEYQSTCRHGTAYTIITSAYSEIETEATYFVPLGAAYEVWLLRVKNAGSRPRSLRAFTYVEFSSEWHGWHDTFNLQYSQYIVDCGFEDGVISHAMCPHLPERPDDFQHRDQGRHCFLALVGATATGFETDRETFVGTYGSLERPATVLAGACQGSLAHGDNGCGTVQVDLELQPGESREFLVLVGVGKGAVAGESARHEMASVEIARGALARLKAHWHERLGALTVKSPDSEFDSMINVWNAYNCLITYAWSRAASLVYSGERDGLGYRDTVQDLLGVLPAIPEEAGERLTLMLTGQLSNGGAMPVVKPFAHHPGREKPPEDDEYRADDCLWLFDTVPAYIKETGRLDYLDEVLPFADDGQGTVLQHLRRALEFNWNRRGAHGLPCGLSADWNDCLRLGYRGESLFVTFQLRHGFRTYEEICTRLGREAESAWAREHLNELDAAIQRHAWDGEWFVRAYTEAGDVIGSRHSEEGKIYLNSQSWAVLSGAATPEQAERALSAMHEHLVTEYGALLCTPPYKKASTDIIRATLFNPGMKENGGIFCHPQGWAVMAECAVGHGDRAYALYRAYMPAAFNARAEIRQIEPYVHCQSTHGRGSRRFGASRLPWLSGTAAWSYFAATQSILGIRPDWDGLRIDPVIPSAWRSFRVIRRFRGATYDIRVDNPAGVERGVKKLLVDGTPNEPRLPLRVQEPGSTALVQVTLG